jgi:hypothetical protein
VIIAGDFNCVLSNSDCTGTPNTSRALAQLTKGLDITDVWEVTPGKEIYTHYTSPGASRIDRICVSKCMLQAKKRPEMIAAAFCDHLAVVLHTASPNRCTTRGRVYWKINASLLNDQHVCASIKQHWDLWKKSTHQYPSQVMWWCRPVKRRVRILFSRIGTDRTTERQNMEHFYYSAMYDLLNAPRDFKEKGAAHKIRKAKIIRLNGT